MEKVKIIGTLVIGMLNLAITTMDYLRKVKQEKLASTEKAKPKEKSISQAENELHHKKK